MANDIFHRSAAEEVAIEQVVTEKAEQRLLRFDTAARVSQKIYYDDLRRGIRCYTHLRYFDSSPYPVIMLTQLPLEDSKLSLTQTIESATTQALECLSHLGIDVKSSSDRVLFVQHYTPSSGLGREHLRPFQPVRLEEGQEPGWGIMPEENFFNFIAGERIEPTTTNDPFKLIQSWISKSVERNGDRSFSFLKKIAEKGVEIFSRNPLL